MSPSPSASVRTTGFEIGLPALSRFAVPQAAIPIVRAAATTIDPRPGLILAFIAASFQLALPSLAAPPSPSHRGLLAILHHWIGAVPYGNPAVTCHDSVVGASWRTVASARAGALTLGALGTAFGLLTLAAARSAPGESFGGTSWMGAVAELTAGWALIAAGVAETWRRPASRAGLLLVGAGIGWFFAEWNNPGLGSSAAFTFGLIASALAAPLVAHAALAYPAGRLESRLDVCVLVVAYAGA